MVDSMISNSVEFIQDVAAFLSEPVPLLFCGLIILVMVAGWVRTLMR